VSPPTPRCAQGTPPMSAIVHPPDRRMVQHCRRRLPPRSRAPSYTPHPERRRTRGNSPSHPSPPYQKARTTMFNRRRPKTLTVGVGKARRSIATFCSSARFAPAGLSVGDRRPFRPVVILPHRSAGGNLFLRAPASHGGTRSESSLWLWGPAPRAEGAIPILSSRVLCVFSSGFWSSGLFSGPGSSSDSRSPGLFCGPGCLATNDHVQSAATRGPTTPLDLNAARLQHFVRGGPAATVTANHRGDHTARAASQASIFFDSGNAIADQRRSKRCVLANRSTFQGRVVSIPGIR
jgi:hypothetical protein